MRELSYQKWAISKRTFNLTWDITSGKVEKKKGGVAEPGLIVKSKKMIEGVSQMHILKTNNNNKKREGDWSKMEGAMEEGIVLHFVFESCYRQDSQEVHPRSLTFMKCWFPFWLPPVYQPCSKGCLSAHGWAK